MVAVFVTICDFGKTVNSPLRQDIKNKLLVIIAILDMKIARSTISRKIPTAYRPTAGDDSSSRVSTAKCIF